MRDWHAVLPASVARSQIAWERAAQIVRARDAKVPLKVIAAKLGVTTERVRQMEMKHRRWTKRPPIELYFEQTPFYDPDNATDPYLAPGPGVSRRRLEQLLTESIAAGDTMAQMIAKCGTLGVRPYHVRSGLAELRAKQERLRSLRMAREHRLSSFLQRVEERAVATIEQGEVYRRDGTRRADPTQTLSAEEAAAEKNR
jgi:hypothetical protein